MKDLKKIWIKIIGGIREKTFKYGKKRKDLNFCYVDELPEIVKETTVYIVGEKGHYWQLGFKCPCKCGDLIQLNLLKEASPQWEFRINNSNTMYIPIHLDPLFQSNVTPRSCDIDPTLFEGRFLAI